MNKFWNISYVQYCLPQLLTTMSSNLSGQLFKICTCTIYISAISRKIVWVEKKKTVLCFVELIGKSTINTTQYNEQGCSQKKIMTKTNLCPWLNSLPRYFLLSPLKKLTNKVPREVPVCLVLATAQMSRQWLWMMNVDLTLLGIWGNSKISPEWLMLPIVLPNTMLVISSQLVRLQLII